MICPICEHDNLPGDEQCGKCQHDLTPYDRPTPGTRIESNLTTQRVAGLAPVSPITIAPTATVREAVALMLRANVGALLVIDPAGRLTGILTERDLMRHVAEEPTDYATQPIAELMTPRPESVTGDDSLLVVLHKMSAGGYRHVPVVEARRPVGILSVRDMLQHITTLCAKPNGAAER